MNKILMFSVMTLGLGLISCESDGDAPVTYADATVNVGESYTIPDSEGCDWKSGNPVVASVTGDIVTTHYAGKSKIWCANGNFNITAEPTVTLYVEPKTQWGAEMKAIKSQLSSGDGYTISSESALEIVYEPNSKETDQLNKSCKYIFKTVLNDKNKEVTSLCRIEEAINADVTLETINKALNQRYPSTAENAYISTDGTMTVTLDGKEGAYTIVYAPVE